MRIRATDLSEPEVRALLELHHAEMTAYSPPSKAHVLDLDALRVPGIEVFAAWDGADLLAIGALRWADDYAEIKSMRASPAARGRGAGKAILQHLVDRAHAAGKSRVSLETGSGELFAPAEGLYRSFGFKPGQPFADYVGSDFNRFFHLEL
ncbi:GNAT family N-acetyltransferase [Erythrobacter litoralis]|uniref:Acetyltransferase, GNAT family protein n=1 Tax=Erythrobacter litoralis (strain HTCC2594) TaxID=314225 RepID=Q2NA53_ERYLH|nr:GNAT family N-acetyltransferase [Erythrobacter litoralis]ABC63438.1 acetyltransferase, GNAT family protein [Erythrobacter litoralis HTCC2594]